jgi:hypothetical protein
MFLAGGQNVQEVVFQRIDEVATSNLEHLLCHNQYNGNFKA